MDGINHLCFRLISIFFCKYRNDWIKYRKRYGSVFYRSVFNPKLNNIANKQHKADAECSTPDSRIKHGSNKHQTRQHTCHCIETYALVHYKLQNRAEHAQSSIQTIRPLFLHSTVLYTFVRPVPYSHTKHSLLDSHTPSHKAQGVCRALVSARPRTMQLVSLARHNLENTWLLCKTNQQAIARLRRSLDTRMN